MTEGRRVCQNCDSELPHDVANFCPSCGAAQRPDPEVPTGPPPSTPRMGRINVSDVPGVPPPPQQAQPPSRKQLLGGLGIGCGAILILLVFAVLVSALGGGGPQEDQAASLATTEEATTGETTAEEETTQARQRVKKPTREGTAAPPPQTPEERLRANIERAYTSARSQLEDLQIQNRNGQCYDIYVRFKGDAALGSNSDFIEYRMEEIYKAVYLERDLADLVCTVRTEATTEVTDNRGNVAKETAYITNLDRTTAATLNWNNADNINFPSVWIVEYEHPSLQQERAQEAVGQAVDCLDDGGLFDFDWLECP